MAYTEDELYNMDDDELEAAFKEAKAEMNSPDLVDEVEEEIIEEVDTSASEEEEFDQTEEDTQDTSEDGEEELESGLEQPEEDSDHDASEDDDATEESEEDAEETDEDTPDGETEEDEAEPAKDDEGVEESPQPVQRQKFKANGREYEFTKEEMEEQFPKIFGQAMDYARKMQAIKPYRKTIDAIESAQLTHEDINLAIDVLKGDKEAIAEVIKRTGVDALDLDAENSNYVAKDYGRDEKALDIKEVVESIQGDKEYSMTHSILSSQWDEASWSKMSEYPAMIALLHEDVKSGMYDTLQPIMDKVKLFDGGKKSDLEYYGMAAQEYANKVTQEQQQERLAQEQAQAERLRAEQEAEAAEQARQAAEAERLENIKAQEQARQATKKASTKRKAAAPSKSSAGKREALDYLDDSDEAFDEWYYKTTGERPVN